MRHHPGKRLGPEHDWKDARNRRDQEHYLGTKDAPDDAICRGPPAYWIKDVDGIRAAGPGARGAPRRDAARLRAAAPVWLCQSRTPGFLARVLGAPRVELLPLQHQPRPAGASSKGLPWPVQASRLSSGGPCRPGQDWRVETERWRWLVRQVHDRLNWRVSR